MKLDQLRKVIREEVREAIKEELQEVMNEAVRIASTPAQQTATYTQPKVTQPKKTYQDPIMEMLSQTKANMTNEEYKTMINMDSSAVRQPATAQTMMNQMSMQSGNQPGIDISQLGFVGKAKQILDASNKKDANRAV